MSVCKAVINSQLFDITNSVKYTGLQETKINIRQRKLTLSNDMIMTGSLSNDQRKAQKSCICRLLARANSGLYIYIISKRSIIPQHIKKNSKPLGVVQSIFWQYAAFMRNILIYIALLVRS